MSAVLSVSGGGGTDTAFLGLIACSIDHLVLAANRPVLTGAASLKVDSSPAVIPLFASHVAKVGVGGCGLRACRRIAGSVPSLPDWNLQSRRGYAAPARQNRDSVTSHSSRRLGYGISVHQLELVGAGLERSSGFSANTTAGNRLARRVDSGAARLDVKSEAARGLARASFPTVEPDSRMSSASTVRMARRGGDNSVGARDGGIERATATGQHHPLTATSNPAMNSDRQAQIVDNACP